MTSQNIDDIINGYLKKQDDFGFTSVSEESMQEKDLTIEEYQSRLEKIEQLIMPLLANLHSTADQAYIHWPNRKDQLEKKMKEFLELTRI